MSTRPIPPPPPPPPRRIPPNVVNRTRTPVPPPPPPKTKPPPPVKQHQLPKQQQQPPLQQQLPPSRPQDYQSQKQLVLPPLPLCPPPPLTTTSDMASVSSCNSNKSASSAIVHKHNAQQQHKITQKDKLLAHLDETFAAMTTSAQNAKKESQNAKENAIAAMDLARQYATRTYHNTAIKIKKQSQQQDLKPISTSTANHPVVSSSVQHNMQTPYPTDHPPTPRIKNTSPSPLQLQQQQQTEQKIAQSHAEDVLTLSLELEKTKSSLESLKNQYEGFAEQKLMYEQRIAELREKVDHAEEDANTALELARNSAEDRDVMQNYLSRALTELEYCKTKMIQMEKEADVLRIASSSSEKKMLQLQTVQEDASTLSGASRGSSKDSQSVNGTHNNTNGAGAQSKALVSMGRDLLHRRRDAIKSRLQEHKRRQHNKNASSAADGGASSEANNNMRNDDESSASQFSSISRTRSTSSIIGSSFFGHGPGVKSVGSVSTSSFLSTASGRVFNRIKESAGRLNLKKHKNLMMLTENGHDRTSNNNNNDGVGGGGLFSAETLDEDDLENVIEVYCDEVESKMKSMQEEITELRSLCDYLEKSNSVALNPS